MFDTVIDKVWVLKIVTQLEIVFYYDLVNIIKISSSSRSPALLTSKSSGERGESPMEMKTSSKSLDNWR